MARNANMVSASRAARSRRRFMFLGFIKRQIESHSKAITQNRKKKDVAVANMRCIITNLSRVRQGKSQLSG